MEQLDLFFMLDANSTEMDPETKEPVVIFMPEGSKTHLGGTMRLGSRVTLFNLEKTKNSVIRSLFLMNRSII